MTVMWARYQVSDRVAALVDQHSDRERLPRNLLRAIVLAESGGNPSADGDGGESIGLLQLHARGQGAGMSVAERIDPERNLAVGVPPIARAWRNSAHMPYDRARVERVALTSGHPIENIDLATPSDDPRSAWQIAMHGARNIGNVWDELQAWEPDAPTPTPVAPAAQAGQTVTEAVTWAREHPAFAVAAGVAAAALLLL